MPKPLITFEDRFRRAGKWMSTMEIIKSCGTVSPSKRISELRAKGRLDERLSTRHMGIKEYRYRTEAAA
jgi:hypothetical protein